MNTDKLASAVAAAIETSQRENRTVDLSASALGVSVEDLLDEVVVADGYEDSVEIDAVVDCWGSDGMGDWRLDVAP